MQNKFIQRILQLVWLCLPAALPVAALYGVSELRATAVWQAPGADFVQTAQANLLLTACMGAAAIWLVSVIVTTASKRVGIGTLQFVCVVPALVAFGLLAVALRFGLDSTQWGYNIALIVSILAAVVTVIVAIPSVNAHPRVPAPAKKVEVSAETKTAAPAVSAIRQEPRPTFAKAPAQEPKPAPAKVAPAASEQKPAKELKEVSVAVVAAASPGQEERPARLN